jgi:hypothetical protein
LIPAKIFGKNEKKKKKVSTLGALALIKKIKSYIFQNFFKEKKNIFSIIFNLNATSIKFLD